MLSPNQIKPVSALTEAAQRFLYGAQAVGESSDQTLTVSILWETQRYFARR